MDFHDQTVSVALDVEDDAVSREDIRRWVASLDFIRLVPTGVRGFLVPRFERLFGIGMGYPEVPQPNAGDTSRTPDGWVDRNIGRYFCQLRFTVVHGGLADALGFGHGSAIPMAKRCLAVHVASAAICEIPRPFRVPCAAGPHVRNSPKHFHRKRRPKLPCVERSSQPGRADRRLARG